MFQTSCSLSLVASTTGSDAASATPNQFYDLPRPLIKQPFAAAHIAKPDPRPVFCTQRISALSPQQPHARPLRRVLVERHRFGAARVPADCGHEGVRETGAMTPARDEGAVGALGMSDDQHICSEQEFDALRNVFAGSLVL